MNRGRTKDLVRRGILASTATSAFGDTLDLDGTSKAGGRESKNKNPRPGNPQPSQYSFDQASSSPPHAGQYQTQGHGYYAQPGNYAQANSNYGQAASGAAQYPPYSSSPQQSHPPPYCTCTLCQHCLGHFIDCYHSQSQLYYCRYHPGHIMKWWNPGIGSHDCPSNHSPPPTNYSYSGYQQAAITPGPSYGSGSGQGYGGATRDLYRNSEPRSLGAAPNQGSPPPDYMLGGGYTQEPAQLPERGVTGEARGYYNSSQYHPTYPR